MYCFYHLYVYNLITGSNFHFGWSFTRVHIFLYNWKLYFGFIFFKLLQIRTSPFLEIFPKLCITFKLERVHLYFGILELFVFIMRLQFNLFTVCTVFTICMFITWLLVVIFILVGHLHVYIYFYTTESYILGLFFSNCYKYAPPPSLKCIP